MFRLCHHNTIERGLYKPHYNCFMLGVRGEIIANIAHSLVVERSRNIKYVYSSFDAS